jgi:hypothetical protein
MIDRNARARLGARIRADRSLTHATRSVANAALFAAMDARTGRCQAYRARLAHEAGCSERSVTRATAALEQAGYVEIVPTYGPRRRQEGGRWFRPRGANVIAWIVPASFLRDKLAAGPSSSIQKRESVTLPEGLGKVLERFGTAIADRAGLPGAPTTP